MAIIEGHKKVKNYVETVEGKQLMSRWTSSDTVEMADNTTLEAAMANKVGTDKLGAASGVATLGTDGKLTLSQIPEVAMDKLVKVADDEARFALTKDDVQTGDTVSVLDTEKLYLVTDDTKLSSEDGYTEYAATTTWDTIVDKPTSIVGYDKDSEVVIPTGYEYLNENSDLKNNVITFQSYDYGTASSEGEFTPEAIGVLTSGSKFSTLFAQLSKIATNVKHMFYQIGNTDIETGTSKVGDGTITGAISTLNTNYNGLTRVVVSDTAPSDTSVIWINPNE